MRQDTSLSVAESSSTASKLEERLVRVKGREEASTSSLVARRLILSVAWWTVRDDEVRELQESKRLDTVAFHPLADFHEVREFAQRGSHTISSRSSPLFPLPFLLKIKSFPRVFSQKAESTSWSNKVERSTKHPTVSPPSVFLHPGWGETRLSLLDDRSRL